MTAPVENYYPRLSSVQLYTTSSSAIADEPRDALDRGKRQNIKTVT